MSGAELEQSLAELGIVCDVQENGRIAVLSCTREAPALSAPARRLVAALAKSHGFTHVALDLGDPSTPDPHRQGD